MPSIKVAQSDKPVSESQRRAMGAAMSGQSNLGIPKSVGKEFIEKDPGGKLPETTGDVISSSNILRGASAFGMESDDCRDEDPPPSQISNLAEARDQAAYGPGVSTIEAIKKRNKEFWHPEWGDIKNKR